MASLEHRPLSSATRLAGSESFPRLRSRPRELVNYLLTALFFDIVVVIAAVFVANAIVEAHLFDEAKLGSSGLPFMLFMLAAWFVGFITVPFSPEDQALRLGDELRRVVTIALIVAVLMFAIVSIIEMPVSHSFLLLTFVLSCVGVVTWRLLARVLFTGIKPLFPRRVLVIGDNELARQYADKRTHDTDSGAIICGFIADYETERINGLPVLGSPDDDLQILIEQNRIDDVAIVIPGKRNEAFYNLFKTLQLLPVNLQIIPEYADLSLLGEDDMLTMRVPRMGMSIRERVIKRLFDITAALFGLFLILPVLVVTAVAIKLDSPGPIFFKQLRVGEHCHRFRMYKFRSMVQNAEKLQASVNTFDSNGNLIHKSEHDPRVTRAGRIIRKYSIDELPQLINILIGDMSFVGPRPEMPWIVNHYETWQFRRFLVPQGLTGWWQVNGRSVKQPMHLATEEDLYYIQNYSLLLDVKILVKTASVVFTGKGAF